MKLSKIVAAHPVKKAPYEFIHFSRIDGCGTPLYRVKGDQKECGAAKALQSVVERFGGECFYCNKLLPPQKLSAKCSRDHIIPSKSGGPNYLYNLVIACGGCNRRKGATNVIAFREESGSEYLAALVAHLECCLKNLGVEQASIS